MPRETLERAQSSLLLVQLKSHSFFSIGSKHVLHTEGYANLSQNLSRQLKLLKETYLDFFVAVDETEDDEIHPSLQEGRQVFFRNWAEGDSG